MTLGGVWCPYSLCGGLRPRLWVYGGFAYMRSDREQLTSHSIHHGMRHSADTNERYAKAFKNVSSIGVQMLA